MASIDVLRYAGRHRHGHPGLVYCREILTRAGLRRTRRWFGLRSVPARHTGVLVAFPGRTTPAYQPATRAA